MVKGKKVVIEFWIVGQKEGSGEIEQTLSELGFKKVWRSETAENVTFKLFVTRRGDSNCQQEAKKLAGRITNNIWQRNLELQLALSDWNGDGAV